MDAVDIEELHKIATEKKQDLYADSNGIYVFTSYGLKKQKECCGKRCRHCPYGHQNVPRHNCSEKYCYHSLSASEPEQVSKLNEDRTVYAPDQGKV